MRRLRWGVLLLAAAGWLGTAACGGGGGSNAVAPPPVLPDFSLSLPTSTINVTQGASTSGINLSVIAEHGFSGTVQVSLTGVPAGVSVNPASPFAVGAGDSVNVVFTAAAAAATGSFTMAASGSSGSLSHSVNIGLTVQRGTVADLPRTSFVRTDTVASVDHAFGEPWHHHLTYDAAHQQVFVANQALNRVEVLSTKTQARVQSVAIPGASSVDIAPDGKTVWVGTTMQSMVAIDAATLQKSAPAEFTGLVVLPGTVFDRPIEVLAMSTGKGVVRLRRADASQALLALWDPSSNALTNLTSVAPQLFQNGVGVLARTGDHAKLLVGANDGSGEIGVFDGSGNLGLGPKSLGNGQPLRAAANADGSRYAVQFQAGSGTNVLLLDGALNTVAVHASTQVFGLTFSPDGQKLYVCESRGAVSAVTVLQSANGNALGQVADVWLQGVGSEIEAADETQLLFGLANRGVSFVDAAAPVTLDATIPTLSAVPSVAPAEGPIAGGTAVTVAGQNFSGNVQVKFGEQLAANAALAGGAQITVSSPPNAAGGTTNVTAYLPGGWLAVAPDAFSYGPQILQIFPNAGANKGGDTVQIYGYGFGNEASQLSAKIGGANAIVTKVENVVAIGPTLGFDASYPFPLERVTLQTPAGASGKADVSISGAAGTASVPKSFQYLQSVQTYARTGPFKFLLYDQHRQRVYLSGTDHVDVFDLQQRAFLPPLLPPGGPPPNAGLRGMALTPDSAKLVVADFGAQSVYLLSPDTGNGSTVAVGGVAGFLNSGPSRVAATSAQTVFVGLSGEGGATGGCANCLAQMNLQSSPISIQPAPQPEVTSLTGAPLLQGNVDGDRVFLAFGTAPGGPLAYWDAQAPNQFTTTTMNAASNDLGAAADGTTFAVQVNGATEFHGGDLTLYGVPVMSELAQIPGRAMVPGVTLHPSGSLIYQPFLTGAPGSTGVKGGVDILDAHSGALRMRIFLPQQFLTDRDGLHGSFLAIDENGQQIFALTSPDGLIQDDALTVVQLASVPLGIGTIRPVQAALTGGTTLTLRGSGFQSGTTVAIGGKSATVSFVDRNTLTVTTPPMEAGPQQVVLKNPDGESYSLDAALTAN